MTLRRVLLAVMLGMGTTAPAVLTAVTPAQAAVPDAWAFGYMQNPTPPGGMLLDPARQWKSDNIPNATVSVIGLGRYQVKFPGIASFRGVAHVTAVAPDARFCQVFRFYASGTDQIVEVQCFKHNALQTPDWSRFSVMYSTSSGPMLGGGAYAYVRGNVNGGVSASYNSAFGANNVTWGGPGTGTYKVWLPGVSSGTFDGNIQVTAEHPNSARRCTVDGWNPLPTGHDILVRCFDQAGALADSWFNLTYHRERPVFGALAPPKHFAYLFTPLYPGSPTNFNSVGAPNNLLPSGPGLTFIDFQKVGFKETHMQVTAVKGPSYCNFQNPWFVSGTSAIIRNVICFDVTGTPADHDFFITYSSRV